MGVKVYCMLFLLFIHRPYLYRTETNFRSSRNEEEEGILSEFTLSRESIQLPAFEPDEHAFWNMRLYWKRDDD